MKVIQLKQFKTDDETLEHLKKPAYIGDVKDVVIDEDFMGIDENGIVQFVYTKLPEDENLTKLKTVLQKIKYNKSTRVSGLSTESSIFGFQPPVPIRARPFCSITGIAQQYPKIDQFMGFYCKKYIMPLFENQYKHNLVEHYEAIKDVKPEWLMKGIPFTGGVINNSNQLNYHTDIQNLKGSINAMIYFQKDTDGGELVVPKWGASIKPKDGYVLLFRNDLVHGVAPIIKLNKDSYRYSIVYYANAGMDKCGTLQEEMEKARKSSNRE